MSDGGYVHRDGAEIPDALLPRLHNDFVITRAEAEAIAVEWLQALQEPSE